MSGSQTQMEAALLGAVIRDRGVFDALTPIRPDDFVDIKNRQIWAKVSSIADKMATWDSGILAAEAGLDLSYLMGLEMSAPRGHQKPVQYSAIIAANGHDRRVRAAADAICRSGASGETLAGMVEQLLDVANSTSIGGPIRLGDSIEGWMKRKEAMMKNSDEHFIYTGFHSYDQRIGGLMPGELLIVAGRPATGKTQWALSVARHVARQGKAVEICNLEMLEDQMLDRMISTSGINLSRLRSPHREGDGGTILVQEMTEAIPDIKDLPIFVDYFSTNFASIASHARRMKRTENIQLLIIDYLQLVDADGRNRTEEVGEISKGLKRLAKSLNIPIIALAQLNREIDKRNGDRPSMSDLRESGSIEQDADFILFLWRHALSTIKPNMPPCYEALGVIETITAKARQATVGTDYLRAEFEYSRFGELNDDEISAYLSAVSPGAPVRRESSSY